MLPTDVLAPTTASTHEITHEP
eukprot:COSAG01_NODE_79706_length_128_cov_4.793103_1_plen_21_part_01